MGMGIAVTPERLREISVQMTTGASDVDAVLSRVAREVAPVRSEWVGAAQTQFEALWAQLQADATGLRSVLTGIANLTQKAAESYEAAEQTIAKSFTEFRVEIADGPDRSNRTPPILTSITREDVVDNPTTDVDIAHLGDNGHPGDVETAESRRPGWHVGKDVLLKNGRKTQ